MSTKAKISPPKLKIDLQFASPAIESAVTKIASTALIKKWVKSATSLGGLVTLRFVNAAEGKKLNLAFRQKITPPMF